MYGVQSSICANSVRLHSPLLLRLRKGPVYRWRCKCTKREMTGCFCRIMENHYRFLHMARVTCDESNARWTWQVFVGCSEGWLVSARTNPATHPATQVSRPHDAKELQKPWNTAAASTTVSLPLCPFLPAALLPLHDTLSFSRYFNNSVCTANSCTHLYPRFPGRPYCYQQGALHITFHPSTFRPLAAVGLD